MKPGKIITIANQKGGVGKTSLTCGVGAALNKLKKRILLVDMDAAAALTFALLGDKAGDLETSIYDILISEGRSLKEILIEVNGGLFLLPSDLALDNLEFSYKRGKYFFLKDKLNAIQGDFDYILIDMPPRLGELSIMSLVASEGVYTVILADILSCRALFTLKEVIDEIANRYNKELDILGIIINFYDKKRSVERFVREMILQEYKVIAFKTAIRRDVAVPEAIIAGKTIFKYDSQTPVVNDFMNLAIEILNREG